MHPSLTAASPVGVCYNPDMPSPEHIGVVYAPFDRTSGDVGDDEPSQILQEGFQFPESLDSVQLQEPFIPVRDAAEALGISEKTIYRYLKSGEVRFERGTRKVVREFSQTYVSLNDIVLYQHQHPTGVNKRWSHKER